MMPESFLRFNTTMFVREYAAELSDLGFNDTAVQQMISAWWGTNV